VVALADLATAINRPASRDGRLSFDDVANSFFMPLVGFGPARLEAPEKISKQWVQVVLDPNRALREYVARWLSSALGRRAREASASGMTIAHTSVSAVCALPLALPPLEEQDRALSLEAQLVALSSEVHQLSDDLWSRPRRIRDISRRVHRLAPDDDIPSWIDSLPLPLATVGRAYYARQDVGKRIDALFHFFEAMAEFHAAVLLSGISADQVYFAEAREDLLGSPEDRRRYYEKGSIGGWTTMAARLSKALRRMSSQCDNGKELGRETVLGWFGRPEPEWFEMITSAALYTTLDEAKRRRNDWKGHGGASSDAVDRDRLAELETLLASVRSVVADRWDDAMLVSSVGMSLSGGTLETTVNVLVGTGMPFTQAKIVTTDALDGDFLYLVHSGGPASMRLLPLVRMMPSPSSANIACYFYNRVDGKDMRYVSYYFEEAPVATVPGGDMGSGAVLQALGLLDPIR